MPGYSTIRVSPSIIPSMDGQLRFKPFGLSSLVLMLAGWGGLVFSRYADPSKRLASLGILCADPDGSHGDGLADHLFPPPTVSRRAACRSQCGRAPGALVWRLRCDTCLAPVGTARYGVCGPGSGRWAGCYRILHAKSRKSTLETSRHHR